MHAHREQEDHPWFGPLQNDTINQMFFLFVLSRIFDTKQKEAFNTTKSDDVVGELHPERVWYLKWPSVTPERPKSKGSMVHKLSPYRDLHLCYIVACLIGQSTFGCLWGNTDPTKVGNWMELKAFGGKRIKKKKIIRFYRLSYLPHISDSLRSDVRWCWLNSTFTSDGLCSGESVVYSYIGYYHDSELSSGGKGILMSYPSTFKSNTRTFPWGSASFLGFQP